jgi:predicted nucleic acid-binding protein
MITLYLDTSSIVKLYVDEPGSDEVRQELDEASAAATSLIAYAEARATFARLRRLGGITPAGLRLAKRDFDTDWLVWAIVPPSMSLCRAAGDLAEEYGLRGFDSVHLATFLQLTTTERSEVRFSSFDRNLSRAATSAVQRHRRSRV